MIREMICKNEPNVINCLNNVSGGTTPIFTLIGAFAIICIPWLVSRVFKTEQSNKFQNIPILIWLSYISASILGLSWLALVSSIVLGLFAWVILFGAIFIGFPLLGLAFLIFAPISIIHLKTINKSQPQAHTNASLKYRIFNFFTN